MTNKMVNDYEIMWKVNKQNLSKPNIEYIEKNVLRSSIDNKEITAHAWSGELTFSYRILPKNRTIEIFKIAKFKFFHWDKDYLQDQNMMFINAKEDFINYLILIHIKHMIPMGTALWLVHQSIEKHLKALLLKSGQLTIEKLRKREYGHNLTALFEKYKKINSESILFKNKDYETLITELNSDGQNTGLRYSGGFYIDGAFTRIFIEICTILRFDFLDKEKYDKRNPLQLGGQFGDVSDIIISVYEQYHIKYDFLEEVSNS